jgi:epoxyqueuosine reductase
MVLLQPGFLEMNDTKDLTTRIKTEAQQLGFPLVGVTSPDPPDHLDFFKEWMSAGYQGSMDWMAADRSLKGRANPQEILPECKSILVLGSPYPAPRGNLQGGNIASYALNQDYHHVLEKRLQLLIERIKEWLGKPVANRIYVDTGPILEKEFGMRAGLGWIGKNTLLINQTLGSYFFLAEILLGIDLKTDPPNTEPHCGSCTLCLDTCPTGALKKPYTLDANRCISYLTIEHKERIPIELRSQMGDWIFGCDICQAVCPWNKSKVESPHILEELIPREELLNIDLVEELGLRQDEFSSRFKGSPIKRSKRRGYLRNVAIALGNLVAEDAISVLGNALNDSEPLIRSHAAWALGEFKGDLSITTLQEATEREEHPDVIQEIKLALKNAQQPGRH